jgi:hypothetical protein
MATNSHSRKGHQRTIASGPGKRVVRVKQTTVTNRKKK